jgi:hypothetical protein
MTRNIFNHRYEAYYIQSPDTGELTPVTREECFNFDGCTERIRFYAPEDSPIIVRLANNEFGKAIECASMRDIWVLAKRIERRLEPPTVSVEDCRDSNNENFVFEIPDSAADTQQTAMEDAYIEFLSERLNAEEFSLLMVKRAGYSLSEYTRQKMREFPGTKENTLYRRYSRLWDKLAVKAQLLRQDWDEQ